MTDAYLNRIATAVPGFDMVLSALVPSAIAAGFPSCLNDIVNGGGIEDCLHWAVHPGGRTVVDAVEEGAGLPKELFGVPRHTVEICGLAEDLARRRADSPELN
jgi:alpha-pyrone synthase